MNQKDYDDMDRQAFRMGAGCIAWIVIISTFVLYLVLG